MSQFQQNSCPLPLKAERLHLLHVRIRSQYLMYGQIYSKPYSANQNWIDHHVSKDQCIIVLFDQITDQREKGLVTCNIEIKWKMSKSRVLTQTEWKMKQFVFKVSKWFCMRRCLTNKHLLFKQPHWHKISLHKKICYSLYHMKEERGKA